MRVIVSFLQPVTEEEVRARLPDVRIVQVFPDLGQALIEVPEDFDLNRIRSQAGIVGAEPEQEFELFSNGDGAEGTNLGQDLDARVSAAIPGFETSVKVPVEEAVATTGLTEVLSQVGVPAAWRRFNRGEGAVVAIVDSGVCGEFFPEEKRAGGIDTTEEGDPWRDGLGHGSMTATIAAGDRTVGNPLNGVAPKAQVFSAKIFGRDGRTSSSRILDAVQEVIRFSSESELPVVMNNSWGSVACNPNQLISCGGFSVNNALRTATNRGVPVAFAAGNAAEKCEKQECTETTIWLQNSIDEVLSVATLDREGRVRSYSSRGPGQCAVVNRKPDVSAPTFGTTVWNCGTRDFTRGWGTSGASPVVAGVLALMVTERPGLSTQTYHDAIRRSGGGDWGGCTGHGTVDAVAALVEVGGGTVPEGAASPSLAMGGLMGLGLILARPEG